MDQLKIGKFIAECRKKNNLTQMQLAEKLNITDRAVSKWETGKTMPDSAIMLELCDVLQITVNDLLNGEKISMENYNKRTEEKLLEIIQEKEQADKRTRSYAYFSTIITTLFTFLLLLVTWPDLDLPFWVIACILFVVGIISIIEAFVVAKILQTVGYQRCKECGYIHVPTYADTLFAVEWGKKKYIRCPECKKRTWHTTVFKKE